MAGGKASYTNRWKIKILRLFIFFLLINIVNAWAMPAQNEYSCGSLRSMARVYMACGENSKAQPLLEKALNLAKQSNAPESELCACMIDSAYLCESQGRLVEAETMCLSGLELQEKIYHKNHPHVAYTLRILSNIYQGQSRYREAAEVLDRALRIVSQGSSGSEREIAPFKADMACLLVAQGEYIKAESYFAESIASIKKSFGPDHLYTARVLSNLAKLYVLQERYDEAEALIGRTLMVYEKVFGEGHHFLVPVWLLNVKTCQAKGNMTDAKELLDKCQLMLDGQTDCGYSVRGNILIQMGQFYISNKEYTMAEDLLQRALTILDDSQGANSDGVVIALNSLAKVYVNQGEYSKAQKLCGRALEILEDISDRNHPFVADVQETLIELYRKTGNTAEAARLQERVEEIRTQQHVVVTHVASDVR